jgi:hypothetical protein
MLTVSNSEPPAASPRTPSRIEQRSLRAQRLAERRRRQRQRLVPLVIAVIVVVALVVWFASRGPGSAKTVITTSPATTTTTIAPYLPPAVKSAVSTISSTEGQWVAKDTWAPGPPMVMTTLFQPTASNLNIVAYASWMRTSSTQLALYPGNKGPGPSNFDRGPQEVPTSGLPNLVATFNSGFYEADASDGFYAHGTLYYPMINGQATLVQYQNGTVDIVNWQDGTTPPADVAMARQNLALLVDNRQPTPNVGVGSDWGITLGGVPAVWRTGIGIDALGNLIYVAAPSQTADSLAQILIQLGCVRAMQLDINPAWPIFVTYGGPGAANPALDVPNPNQTASRFLSSSTKDFFALYQRIPGVVQQPW